MGHRLESWHASSNRGLNPKCSWPCHASGVHGRPPDPYTVGLLTVLAIQRCLGRPSPTKPSVVGGSLKGVHPKGRALILDCHDGGLGCCGRSGQRSRMQAAAARFGTALANVEPEELRYSPASSSTQNSSPANVLSRAHALPENIDRVCPQRSGDYGARLLYSIAVLGPKGASRGRCFPVHPAGPRSCQGRCATS